MSRILQDLNCRYYFHDFFSPSSVILFVMRKIGSNFKTECKIKNRYFFDFDFLIWLWKSILLLIFLEIIKFTFKDKNICDFGKFVEVFLKNLPKFWTFAAFGEYSDAQRLNRIGAKSITLTLLQITIKFLIFSINY